MEASGHMARAFCRRPRLGGVRTRGLSALSLMRAPEAGSRRAIYSPVGPNAVEPCASVKKGARLSICKTGIRSCGFRPQKGMGKHGFPRLNRWGRAVNAAFHERSPHGPTPALQEDLEREIYRATPLEQRDRAVQVDVVARGQDERALPVVAGTLERV